MHINDHFYVLNLIIQLWLFRINKVYDWLLLYKAHKHYNYLQLIKHRDYIDKILKMPSREAWILGELGIL
jgi:hypothetical protein